MRRYELMLLLRPDLEDDKLQSAVEKVTRAIVNAGGSLAKVSPWGKRRLAYDIKHHRDASYFLIHFDIEPAEIRPLERGLLISEEILRHLVTVIEERPADEAEAIKATPAAAPAEGEEGEARYVAPEAIATSATEVEAPEADATDQVESATEADEADATDRADPTDEVESSDEADATDQTDATDEAEREPAETPA